MKIKSPCGVEIKIGQRWRALGNNSGLMEVIGFHGNKVLVRWEDDQTEDIPSFMFVNIGENGFKLEAE